MLIYLCSIFPETEADNTIITGLYSQSQQEYLQPEYIQIIFLNKNSRNCENFF
jgi:hypothetical protein